MFYHFEMFVSRTFLNF